MSMSVASRLAAASALRAATSARSVVSTWEMPRSRMPVRSTIQSLSVSMSCSRSALVSFTGGTHLPQPVKVARVVISGGLRAGL